MTASIERLGLTSILGNDQSRTPEEELFAAVLIRAILDTSISLEKPDNRYIKGHAEQWLADRPASFLFVCDLAGIHPDEVARALKSYQARGGKWYLTKKTRKKRAYRKQQKPSKAKADGH